MKCVFHASGVADSECKLKTSKVFTLVPKLKLVNGPGAKLLLRKNRCTWRSPDLDKAELCDKIWFPSSSLGTLLAGEALLRHLLAPRPHEKPLYHQGARSPLLHHLHRGPMDSPLHPETTIFVILSGAKNLSRQATEIRNEAALRSE
jgi:hypothetical protein